MLWGKTNKGYRILAKSRQTESEDYRTSKVKIRLSRCFVAVQKGHMIAWSSDEESNVSVCLKKL